MIDIETTPNIVYRWGKLWKPESTSVNMLIEPTHLLCFAAKWLNESKVLFHRGDGMLAALFELLDEADIVVHFNGERFDIPHIRRELSEAGLWQPSPFKQVDLKKHVSRTYEFPSDKLAYVAPALGLDCKEDTGGFELWPACMAGDTKAWKKMERYNRQDVKVTEQLYQRELGNIYQHPNVNLFQETADCCPNCGSSHTWRRGYAYSGVSRFPRYQCQECGKYYRGGKRDFAADAREMS